jgi:hypothetical protein
MKETDHTLAFARVVADERERIDAQRAHRGVGAGPLTGLAISGGGIRSACFGLGVLQALYERGAFSRLDYLSTVSGGGYAGAALTWFTRSGRGFPFAASSPGTPLDFMRRQASYLSPSRRMTLFALAAVVLQQMVISLFVYGSLLVGFFFVLDFVDRLLRPLKAILGLSVEDRAVNALLPLTNVAGLVALLLAAAFVVSALWEAVGTFLHRFRRGGLEVRQRDYLLRLHSQLRATRLLRWSLYAVVVASVPATSLLLERWVEAVWARGALIGMVTAVAGLVGSMWLGRTQAGDEPADARGRARAVGGAVIMVVLLYDVLLLCYTTALAIGRGSAVWTIVFVAAGIVLGLLSNPNAHGSHRVYRDRLMEAFLPDEEAVAEGRWRPVKDAPGFPLTGCSSATTQGPYPLINASLTTSSSRNPQLRGRGADSFLLSPLYCGSTATGWLPTHAWLQGRMTLVNATSISAAAADPHAAPAGQGATRGPLLSVLLAILNLRLGFLARNPHPDARKPWLGFRPNLIVPGLSQNLLGRGLAETRPYIELADGGNFENLGLYELVRRRVDVIVVSDASEDPAVAFGSLGNAVERVRADFGVTIAFDDRDRDLEGLLPGSGGFDPASRAYELTRRAWAVGRIRYPVGDGTPAKEGVLLYVKATLVPGLAADVLAFKAAHPSFPNESTFNQMFDESRFEAYRELGRSAALAMLSDAAAISAFALTGPSTPRTPAPVRSVDPGIE